MLERYVFWAALATHSLRRSILANTHFIIFPSHLACLVFLVAIHSEVHGVFLFGNLSEFPPRLFAPSFVALGFVPQGP